MLSSTSTSELIDHASMLRLACVLNGDISKNFPQVDHLLFFCAAALIQNVHGDEDEGKDANGNDAPRSSADAEPRIPDARELVLFADRAINGEDGEERNADGKSDETHENSKQDRREERLALLVDGTRRNKKDSDDTNDKVEQNRTEQKFQVQIHAGAGINDIKLEARLRPAGDGERVDVRVAQISLREDANARHARHDGAEKDDDRRRATRDARNRSARVDAVEAERGEQKEIHGEGPAEAEAAVVERDLVAEAHRRDEVPAHDCDERDGEGDQREDEGDARGRAIAAVGAAGRELVDRDGDVDEENDDQGDEKPGRARDGVTEIAASERTHGDDRARCGSRVASASVDYRRGKR